MTSPAPRPRPAAPLPHEPAGPAEAPETAARLREPLLPEQSAEDTDAAWGEYPVPGDDRLHRDRPPHWDDF